MQYAKDKFYLGIDQELFGCKNMIEPKMALVEEYESFLKARLNELTNRLSGALNFLFENLPIQNEFNVHFEYEVGELVNNFPIYVYFNTIDLSEHDNEICEKLNLKLQAIGAIITQEEQDRFIVWEKIDDGSSVHAIEQPVDSVESEIIIEWFRNTWQQTNKTVHNIKAQIYVHDSASDPIQF